MISPVARVGRGVEQQIDRGDFKMARITVEDCIKKVPSRFSLVRITAQRARQLLKGAKPHVKPNNKIIVTALREIATGDVSVEKDSIGE